MIPHVDVIIVTNYDDWAALYIDGTVVYQHHSISYRDFAEHLVGKAIQSFKIVEVKTYDDWEVSEYPEKFEDIPAGVIIS